MRTCSENSRTKGLAPLEKSPDVTSGLKSRPQARRSLTGFTLIETIIYAALVSVSIGLVLGAVYQIISAGGRLQARVEVEAEANFLMNKIRWAANGATIIHTPAESATSSVLSLDRTTGPNPIVIDNDSGNVRIQQGGGQQILLNSGTVRVSELVFERSTQSILIITLIIEDLLSGPYGPTASTTAKTALYLPQL